MTLGSQVLLGSPSEAPGRVALPGALLGASPRSARASGRGELALNATECLIGVKKKFGNGGDGCTT